MRHIQVVVIIISLIMPGIGTASTEGKNPESRIIDAEGSGSNREQAVYSALRAAVEQGVGLFVSSDTKVENFQLIHDKIFTRTRGYVSRYKVIDGSERTEYGLTHIKVRAEVSTARIRDDLEAIRLIYSLKNLPRIMVVTADYAAGKKLVQQTGATVLEDELLAKKFTLVDQSQLAKLKERDLSRPSVHSELARAGFRFGADLIITGVAVAGTPYGTDVYGVKQMRVPVQINYRLIRADNARVISVASFSNDWGAQSSMKAMNTAITRAAKKASKKLIAELIDFWKSEVYNTTRINVTVNGMHGKQLNELNHEIAKGAMVRSVSLRYIERDKAVFDVEAGGTVQRLREHFVAMPDISIVAMSANSIELERTGGGGAAPPQIAFDPQPPSVEIASASIQTLFPCARASYATTPAAFVDIQNNGSSTLSAATVSVSIDKYTTQASNGSLGAIQPGNSERVEITLYLEKNVLVSLTDPVNTQATVQLAYNDGAGERKRALSVPVTIQNSNALHWATPSMAASFITPNNPTVKALSRFGLGIAGKQNDNTVIRCVLHAAAVYATVQAGGITYVKDPNMAPGHEVVDQIQYPIQTLRLKSGDCDDTSVLLASLMESVGIETALVVYPEHVMVMFNTGVHEKNRRRISYDPDNFIIHNEMVWIPVETTRLGTFNFVQAWESAAAEFNRAAAGGENITIVDIHDAWKSFPPSDPFAQGKAVPDPGRESVQTLFTQTRDYLTSTLATQSESAEQEYIEALETKPSPKLYSMLGVVYVHRAQQEKAEEMFVRALELDKNDGAAMNNLANVYCLDGEDGKALQWYDKAVSVSPRKAEYMINKGLCYFTAGSVDKSLETLKEGIALLGSAQKLERVLGMSLAELTEHFKAGEAKSAKKKQISRAEIKNLMRKVLEKVPDKEIKSYSKNVLPVGGLRGADPEQVEKVADLLWWDEE
jgi:Tfp pilus assembly protein PilF